MITRVIHEPVSGNIILTGYENGEVKLFDLRQNRSTSLLEWDGSEALPEVKIQSRNIRKVGMALGQSSHISSAASVPSYSTSNDLSTRIKEKTDHQCQRDDQHP
jgi:hypothetical protein